MLQNFLNAPCNLYNSIQAIELPSSPVTSR